MSTDRIEAPRYRVLAEGVFVDGSLRTIGSEVTFDGWPKPTELAPVNDSARAIVAYRVKFHADSHFPRSPWLAEHDTYYLPGILHRMSPHLHVRGPQLHGGEVVFDGPGSELPSPVPEDQVTPGMPMYRVCEREMPPLRRGELPYMRRIKQVGRYRLQPDEVFAHLAWPGPDFEPANAAAEKVAAYYEVHKEHGSLLSSPFCMLRNGPFLPELQGITRRSDTAAPVHLGASNVAAHTTKDQLPPYARADMKHLFRDVIRTGANKAKPLLSRR